MTQAKNIQDLLVKAGANGLTSADVKKAMPHLKNPSNILGALYKLRSVKRKKEGIGFRYFLKEVECQKPYEIQATYRLVFKDGTSLDITERQAKFLQESSDD